MRYLKPKGTPILINDKQYQLLFTLDVIDEIQSRTKFPISEVIHMATEKKYQRSAIEVLLKYLTGDNIEVKDNELDYYSTILIDTYIEQLKSKPYEGEPKGEPSDKYEFINVERLFYIATDILGRSEEEAWSMTLGKLFTLQKEHLFQTGQIKEDKEVNIDDVI
jgi:hypothetical protein